LLALALTLGACAALPALVSAAAPAPAWKLSTIPFPANFAPGADGSSPIPPRYMLLATNIGEGDADGPITVSATLPTGLTPLTVAGGCPIAGQTITCTSPTALRSGQILTFEFEVEVDDFPDPTVLAPTEATISSPGAAPVSTTAPVTVSAAEAPFGLLEGPSGLGAMLTEADGSPATAAGSHPSQLTVNLALPTKSSSKGNGATNFLGVDGSARDIRTTLPKGLVIDPSATPVRCTEAQLQSRSCPNESTLGKANVTVGSGFLLFSSDNLFNLEPPPGAAAEFGFEPLDTGLFVHVLGGLRAGDYALTGASKEIPSLFNHPLYGVQLQFWGDPSASSHDYVRNGCGVVGTLCPVPKQDAPALSLSTSCSPSLAIETEIDSWGHPGDFLARSAPFTDLEGNPAEAVSGCNAVPFKPTLSVQPTTNLADSPTGLDVDLEIPQSTSLATTATAHLKQAVVTLPEGMAVNPSSANGLQACRPAQIGIDPVTGVADGERPSCPDAAKIGTVEVESPLLAEYDSENKVQRDGDGAVIAEPVPGSVYLATPHENPFGSLLAIYIALDDPEHGLVVKLAGKVVADPQTGRLTTTFSDNPQLPVSAFKLRFFGGAGAPLRTPLTCGAKATTSTLTPWSSPEGADVTDSDSFQTSATPGGGPCPTTDGAAPNSPAFSAGTLAPQAGAYSPFVLKLSREDGTQPISAIDTTLPPGLTGKLAGIAYCPEGALADAAAKSGSAEKAGPSCPASSEVGSVVVGAGAGPTPYYTQGKAYLAGPYKGAPLSLAIVTPATAGPYDLGTVVVRTALQVDPETARIRAVSDPIPQILQGIPLDVRSIALKMGRPQFTLNPTSCDPMALTGNAISPFGSSAALTSPFQVGGCGALPFKPKLTLKLSGGTKRGGHPALKAVLTAKPGEANIAKSVVALPKSEFLEQAHIKTICTRVQFAASACPPGSIYGKATAITPLLDQPLSGPVYMRSSSNQLPDLVADLNGQIHVALVGRIDSVKGGIRTSFESVPDAPVTKFVLQMRGGKKGLLVNSRDICKGTHRASVQMDGQNGKAYDTRPKLKAKCRKGTAK
jgi:hypothetical protein